MSSRQVKAHLKNLFYLCVDPLRHFYWHIAKPKRYGAKAVVIKDGKILLVRTGYGHRSWTLPGGAVDKGEGFIDAARRELEEETGMVVRKEDLSFLYEYDHDSSGRQVTTQAFICKTDAEHGEPDGFEIREIGWFDPAHLPEPHIASVAEAAKKVPPSYV